MLKHLNLTNDPALEQARVDMVRAMSGLDITDLKDSAHVRADTKAKLDKILEAYEW